MSAKTRPDFLIIGAMKCGTSTLQAQIAGAQGVFMTDPKEPNFFSDDDIYARGTGWYAALYAEAAPGDLCGEASTHYTKLPTYPQTVARMAEMLKAPRLIYMIRNPVDRAVSHYIHEWSEGRLGDDMEAAFASDSTLFDYGRYAMQLQPFLDQYGRDALHLTSLEAVKRDPQGELDAISEFLGLAMPARWDPDLGAQNVSAERARKFPMQRLLLGNPVARALRRTLLPKSLRTRIREGRKMTTRPELSDALRAQLENVYATDRADLARIFPGHPALSDCYPFVTP